MAAVFLPVKSSRLCCDITCSYIGYHSSESALRLRLQYLVPQIVAAERCCVGKYQWSGTQRCSSTGIAGSDREYAPFVGVAPTSYCQRDPELTERCCSAGKSESSDYRQ